MCRDARLKLLEPVEYEIDSSAARFIFDHQKPLSGGIDVVIGGRKVLAVWTRLILAERGPGEGKRIGRSMLQCGAAGSNSAARRVQSSADKSISVDASAASRCAGFRGPMIAASTRG